MPVHLLLAFLVAAAHRHGYLTWFKEEWVTYRFWRSQIRGLLEGGFARRPTTATDGRPAVATGEDVRPVASRSGGAFVPDRKTQ